MKAMTGRMTIIRETETKMMRMEGATKEKTITKVKTTIREILTKAMEVRSKETVMKEKETIARMIQIREMVRRTAPVRPTMPETITSM